VADGSVVTGNRTAKFLGSWILFEDEAGHDLKPDKNRTMSTTWRGIGEKTSGGNPHGGSVFCGCVWRESRGWCREFGDGGFVGNDARSGSGKGGEEFGAGHVPPLPGRRHCTGGGPAAKTVGRRSDLLMG
jgi:hypothetical protein